MVNYSHCKIEEWHKRRRKLNIKRYSELHLILLLQSLVAPPLYICGFVVNIECILHFYVTR